MTLDEVIKHLEEQREIHGGDIPVFLNGEHGESQPIIAETIFFSFGEADLTLGNSEENIKRFGLLQKQKILQIGGH